MPNRYAPGAELTAGASPPPRVTSEPKLVTIPPGGQATATVDLTAFRSAEVVIENAASTPIQVTHPAGPIPSPNVSAEVQPRTRLRLMNINDTWDSFTVSIDSATGATVQISASGVPVPLVVGEATVPQRDPVTGLLTRVLRRPALVPGP
jgi:hypothetical protein